MTTIEIVVAIALTGIGYAWGNRDEDDATDDEPWSIAPGVILVLPHAVEFVPYVGHDTDSTGCRS